MSVRIAIPVPTSNDAEYNARSLPAYLSALRQAGAEPVVIETEMDSAGVARVAAETDGLLLPGSRYDVNPERYGELRIKECGPADSERTQLDEQLLSDAFRRRKPILGICHGTQSLNVWCGGTLIQDLRTTVNHRAGREVMEAHPVKISYDTILSSLLPQGTDGLARVTSTHHQAICEPGNGLRVAAVSPEDGVIEAVGSVERDWFLLAVQWHPERSYDVSEFSRRIFQELIASAERWSRANDRI